MSKFPFVRPVFPHPSEYMEDLLKMEKNNWYSNNGPFVQNLERYLHQYLKLNDQQEVVTCNNATSGLISLFHHYRTLTRDPSKHNTALVPSFTFAATVQALKLAGWKIRYVDIDEDTLCITTKTIMNQMSESVGLIVPVATLGYPVDINDIYINCKRNIVVDAAPAFGTIYKGSHFASHDCASLSMVFSLHATKTLPVGEGGFIVTASAALGMDDAIRSSLNFGFNKDRIPSNFGFNGKMSEIEAIIGIHSLKKFEGLQEVRRQSAKRYAFNLKDYVSFAKVEKHSEPSYQTIPILCEKRDKLLEFLLKNDIIARNYYFPLIHQVIKDYDAVGSLPNTDSISKKILCIPVYGDMTINEVDYISEKIIEFYKK